MYRPLLLLALVFAFACNVSQMNKPAPEIEGKAWIRAGGDQAPADFDQRWTLVEFFSPT